MQHGKFIKDCGRIAQRAQNGFVNFRRMG